MDDPVKILYYTEFSCCQESYWRRAGKPEKAEFIEPLISPNLALIVCVAKPDGTLRVTIDFGMVNKIIVNDAYPMLWVEGQLEAISRATVFSTLDLTKA